MRARLRSRSSHLFRGSAGPPACEARCEHGDGTNVDRSLVADWILAALQAAATITAFLFTDGIALIAKIVTQITLLPTFFIDIANAANVCGSPYKSPARVVALLGDKTVRVLADSESAWKTLSVQG